MGYYDAPTFGELFMAFLIGAIVGALFSDKMRPYRKYLGYALAVIGLFIVFKLHIPYLPNIVFFVIGLVVALKLLRDKLLAARSKPLDLYGDAQWADLDHLQQNGVIEQVEIVGGGR